MVRRMESEFKEGVQTDRERENSLDKMDRISTRQSPLTIQQCTITNRQRRNDKRHDTVEHIVECA